MGSNIKIVTIVGTRPQIIKSMYMAIKFREYGIQETIVNTGQHYDFSMDGIFYTKTPDFNLNIKNEDTNAFLLKTRFGLNKIIKQHKPNGIVVYGDTLSTMAGALASYSNNIPLFHIEAGLRSGDSSMPEEMSRVVTDTIAYQNFCPTKNAVVNLSKENLRGTYTGDLLVEIFNKNIKNIPNKPNHSVLATIHRKENTDDVERLKKIFNLLSKLAVNTQVIMPLHPRTRKAIYTHKIFTGGIKLLDPISLDKMYDILLNCKFVVTDSGGLQREAYLAGKPCFVARTTTEWKDLIELSNQKLIGISHTNPNVVFIPQNKTNHKGLLGDGNTSHHIIKKITDSMEEFK